MADMVEVSLVEVDDVVADLTVVEAVLFVVCIFQYAMSAASASPSGV
jgi:hypothetical protein